MTTMIIRAKTFRAWMQANLNRGQIADLARHGADAGWPGLIYTVDTRKLYQRFKSEIWDMLAEDAESQGLASPWALIATFNYANSLSDSVDGAETLLVWYAAERCASELAEA